MPDLETQLRRYCMHLDEAYPNPDASEFAPAAGRSRWPRWAVGLAAAVVTLVVLGVPVLFLVRGGRDVADPPVVATTTVPATTPVTAPPPTTPTQEATTTVAASAPSTTTPAEPVGAVSVTTGDGWTRLVVSGLIEPGYVKDMAAVGETVVAVGEAVPYCEVNYLGRTSTCRPIVWSSQDRGRSWMTIDIGEDGDIVWAVAATDTGFLAVGESEIIAERVQGIVWISPDGITWERRLDPVFAGAYLFDVATGPGGVAVAGACVNDGECLVAVWTSPYGRTWSTPQTLGQWHFTPTSIAAHDGGLVVAHARASGGVQVWTSPDGEIWQESDPRIPTTDALRARMAASDRGIVIAMPGYHLGQPAAAFATDGTIWGPITVSGCTTSRFTDLAATSDGFLAVGHCGDLNRVAVWASGDGTTWQLISTDDLLFVGEPQVVHADQHGVIVLGSDSEVWITDAARAHETTP